MRRAADAGRDVGEARALAARLLPWRVFRRILREEIPRGSALGREALLVLAAHAVVMLIVLSRGLMLTELIWAFFWQSVFNFVGTLRRLWALEAADLAGLTVRDDLPPAVVLRGLKITLTATMVFIGLLAHLLYAGMLAALTARWPEGAGSAYAWLVLALLALQIFAANRRQIHEDRLQPPVFGAVVASPFLALVFLHGTLMIGVVLGAGAAMTVAFLLLKTVFEVTALAWEREWAAVLTLSDRRRPEAGR